MSVTVAGPAEQRRELLTGPDVRDLLAAALSGAGGTVLAWRAHQVEHQPQGATTAAYRVRVRWPDGWVSQERFAASVGFRTPPPGTLVLGDGAERVAVWRFPHDPYLPALATAYDPGGIGDLLASLGVTTRDAPPVRLRVRAYRPRRRAVVEAIAGSGQRLFLKVVRPQRVAALHQRHRSCLAAGVPVPASLGYTDAGLLVLAALPGTSLREALRTGSDLAPSGAALLALLDRLPAELTAGAPRRSWRDRAGHYASVVAGVLPEQAPRACQLAEAIGSEAAVGPVVPAHGDFYENQLWVEQDRLSGLLDLDTVGPGDRLDDLACLLGHLSVLHQIDAAHAAVIGRVGARYLAAFDRAVDPAALRYRVAAVVLSLATGPYRVQEPNWRQATGYRLELAERWLRSARIVGGG